MTTASGSTRERIQDAAQALILVQGYAATSIDQIIARVGVTKGAFFYHFRSKNDLARALVERYAHSDLAILEENLARAEKLSPDPLQQLLIFVGLLLEMLEEVQGSPGCLFASYCYESGNFDDEIRGTVTRAIMAWREAIAAKLRAACELYPPRKPIDPESLADLLTTIVEGAYIMARVFQRPGMLAGQLAHYRAHLELLFER